MFDFRRHLGFKPIPCGLRLKAVQRTSERAPYQHGSVSTVAAAMAAAEQPMDGGSEASFGAQPVPATPAAPMMSTTTPMTTMSLDTRGFAKPPRFSGKQEDWPAWAFRVESFAALCGWFEVMENARNHPQTIHDSEMNEHNRHCQKPLPLLGPDG